MTTLTIADEVATLANRLSVLERKSKADDQMLELLHKQNDELSQELTDATHNFDVEMFQMRQERDEALKKAEDVKIIIETISGTALSGLRRMKGDETTEQIKDRPPLIVKHLQASDARLSGVEPQSPLPPKPSLMDDYDHMPMFLRDKLPIDASDKRLGGFRK